MQIWMFPGFALEANGCSTEKILCIFNCFCTTHYANMDTISEMRLQGASLKESKARIRMLVSVSKLQLRLIENITFKIHQSTISS